MRKKVCVNLKPDVRSLLYHREYTLLINEPLFPHSQRTPVKLLYVASPPQCVKLSKESPPVSVGRHALSTTLILCVDQMGGRMTTCVNWR